MILRGLIIDYLWFDQAVGVKLLDELFYHFDIINEPNFGKSPVVITNKPSATTPVPPETIIIPSDYYPVDGDMFLGSDSIFLDPDVASCLGSSLHTAELVRSGTVGVQNQDFIPVLNIYRNSKIKAVVNFELPTSNSFDCLASYSSDVITLECSGSASEDKFANKQLNMSDDCSSPGDSRKNAYSSGSGHLNLVDLNWQVAQESVVCEPLEMIAQETGCSISGVRLKSDI